MKQTYDITLVNNVLVYKPRRPRATYLPKGVRVRWSVKVESKQGTCILTYIYGEPFNQVPPRVGDLYMIGRITRVGAKEYV